MTDQEKDIMIRSARAGDPKANYQMALWALEKAGEEPDDERWNKLAAKCLVTAAKDGYAPAKNLLTGYLGATALTMDETEQPEWPTASPQQAEPEQEPEEYRTQPLVTVTQPLPPEPVPAAGDTMPGFGAWLKERAGAVAEWLRAIPHWNAAQWKKAQRGAIIAMAVLAVVIVLIILVVPDKPDTIDYPGTEEQSGSAETQTVGGLATPSPTPQAGFNQTDLSAIQTTEALSYRPAEDEYFESPREMTVVSEAGLNMRSGPGTDYDIVNVLSYKAYVQAFAQSGDFILVKFNGAFGWASAEYLDAY